MSQISASLLQYLIFVYAVTIGILIGFYLIFLNKVQEYIKLKETKNIWFKMKEGFLKVALAIASLYFVFILPVELLRQLIIDQSRVKNLYEIYFYSVVCSSIVSILILIKLGKIQINKKS